ncbi:hypothetical protein T10_997 [Trichinella papuae]|uniref:Uncharacterized protein n=1 Tax=Trichinella papuae TaxID=268474 RepID=A0A0V1MM68_9BILA|nr:hypothetical protein T10_997 [Trichinella papuae]
MLRRRVKWKPCFSTTSGSGFQPLKFRHGVAVWTNNHLEGWHSRMNKKARKHHLGFYQVLRLIIDEQGKTETVVRQMDDDYTRGRGSVGRSAAYGVSSDG